MIGTPVFKTMGGRSKCPGETATSKRESNYQIMEISPRCGSNGLSVCDATTLNAGDKANFAIVIYNDSPTGNILKFHYYNCYLSLPFNFMSM